MKFFTLPDLGEGLTEAEISEWFVSAGESVRTDQLLVAVETAKAIVEIPSPCDGEIAAVFGQPGEVIHVGEPLVEFAGMSEDAGTVVGEIGAAKTSSGDQFQIGGPSRQVAQGSRAMPAVRALAARLGVDLAVVRATGSNGMVTAADVQQAQKLQVQHGAGERLRGVRRSMARNMARAHAEVVPVTLFDVADVQGWSADEDATVRLAQAIAKACAEAPALNAWFDGEAESRQLLQQIDLGIAVNTEDGLFVPVLRDVGNRSREDLRDGVDRLRTDVQARSIPPKEMIGASITLSNYGTLGGHYGTPVVIPPMVAILGAGEIRAQPAVHEGELAVRRLLPLSLTFDHRAVTGAEAMQFLGVVKARLSQVASAD